MELNIINSHSLMLQNFIQPKSKIWRMMHTINTKVVFAKFACLHLISFLSCYWSVYVGLSWVSRISVVHSANTIIQD